MATESPPSIVLDLVERFDRNRAGYESSEYKEEQLRSEFLNPFFTALGWDVENRKGSSLTRHRPLSAEKK